MNAPVPPGITVSLPAVPLPSPLTIAPSGARDLHGHTSSAFERGAGHYDRFARIIFAFFENNDGAACHLLERKKGIARAECGNRESAFQGAQRIGSGKATANVGGDDALDRRFVRQGDYNRYVARTLVSGPGDLDGSPAA